MWEWDAVRHIRQQIIQLVKTIIWITPLILLGQNVKQRLSDKNIDYKYNKDIKNKNDISNYNNLIVCINLLHYNDYTDYKIVVIDEIKTLLHKWFDNDTLNKSPYKTDCWNRCVVDFIRCFHKSINH